MIDSYDKLSIGKWQEILEISETIGMSEEEKNIAVIAVLNDLTEDEVLNLPLSQFAELNKATAFLTQLPQKRLMADKYILGDTEFKVLINLTQMTAGQYIDYQTYVKDPDNNLVQIISIFLIPKGKKYNEDYDMAEVHKLIREHLSIVDAMSISAFFLLLSEISIKTTLTSSIKKMKKMMRKEKNKEQKNKLREAITHLESVGDGLAAWTE